MIYFKVALPVYILFISVFEVNAQANPCVGAEDCQKCIQAGSECQWCLESNYTLGVNAGRPRCNYLSAFENQCKNTTADLKTAPPDITKSDNLGDKVLVSPQEVKLKLRPGQPSTFTVSVRPAENFPVDIYYLMDVSFSMKDDLKNLQTLGQKIAIEIQTITTKFRFAFGSFVDKLIAPYVQPYYADPVFPCSNRHFKDAKNCRPVFSYIHAFNFSDNATAFEVAVAAQNISGDVDIPEGGFDGLMQAAVCEQVLNWQEKGTARRIIILVTDAFPKIAGDAKVSGILQPNDGKCHMDRSADGTELYYTASNIMDYPSIYHLKQAMLENEIVPILAVTEKVLPTYSRIQKEWQDLGAAIGVLSTDSSNIVELIKENYLKISSTVRLTNENIDNFKIDYQVTGCRNVVPSKPNECANVLKSEQVDFNVSVTALRCPTDPTKAVNSFSVRIPGFGEVKVNVDLICDCSCQQEANSPQCNNAGTLECGICKCNPNRYGSQCQCDTSTLGGSTGTEGCVAPDNSTCSNSGLCACQKCECFKPSIAEHQITGRFCECKNFDCPRSADGICGGDGRGECKCGKCECGSLYTGADCSISNCEEIVKAKCLRDGKICSGHGDCICTTERCKCQSGYTGEFCDECKTRECVCPQLSSCVLCHVFEKKGINCTGCDQYNYARLQANVTKSCSAFLNDSCLVHFHVSNDFSVNETIIVLDKPVCTAISTGDDPDLLAIILGIIAGILLLGLLLLLLWKLITMIHDRRDFEKFKESQKESQWEKDGNPIYQQPNQQFVNPTYAG